MTDAIRQLASKEFPPLLKEIPDAPKKLYLRGTLPKPSIKLLCVVGSRRYSPYGKEVCERLISGLGGYPVVIVSGLALGIDSIAHRAALQANLETIAIPGSGLDETVLYPRTHTLLAHEILRAGGALLSEFEPKTKAAPHTFPQRNRIMAGISHATLIIEATEKSGTLITARLTSDYNRELLAVPGSIFSRSSHGPHQFIRLGATLVSRSEDILDALGIEPSLKQKIKRVDMTDREQKILLLLHSPLPRDLLVSKLNMEIKDANTLLSVMLLKGLIEERLGKIYTAGEGGV